MNPSLPLRPSSVVGHYDAAAVPANSAPTMPANPAPTMLANSAPTMPAKTAPSAHPTNTESPRPLTLGEIQDRNEERGIYLRCDTCVEFNISCDHGYPCAQCEQAGRYCFVASCPNERLSRTQFVPCTARRCPLMHINQETRLRRQGIRIEFARNSRGHVRQNVVDLRGRAAPYSRRNRNGYRGAMPREMRERYLRPGNLLNEQERSD